LLSKVYAWHCKGVIVALLGVRGLEGAHRDKQLVATEGEGYKQIETVAGEWSCCSTWQQLLAGGECINMMCIAFVSALYRFFIFGVA